MKKYYVVGTVDATTATFNCEAEDPMQAMDQFYDSDEASPSVCHHCSDEVEVTEVYQARVYDAETHEEVASDADEKVCITYVKGLLESEMTKEDILKELLK